MLTDRPDPEAIAHWASIGVTEVNFSLPDAAADVVAEAIAERGRTVAPLRAAGRS